MSLQNMSDFMFFGFKLPFRTKLEEYELKTTREFENNLFMGFVSISPFLRRCNTLPIGETIEDIRRLYGRYDVSNSFKTT